MTRDELIRIAREVGIEFCTHTGIGGRTNIYSNGSKSIQVFEHFAEMVAAAEREACAKLCMDEAKDWVYPSRGNAAATMCAQRILDRSQPTKGEDQK